MKRYESIGSLIADYENLPVPGRIYIEYANIQKIDSAYYVTTTDAEERDADYTEDEWGRRLPDFLANEGVKSWLDTATFQDIVGLKLENDKNLGTKDVEVLVGAINHYLEFDDFED